ncbi:DUF945 domain-containing protein [Halomonas sp. ND22Bw]|uniref:DUF945 family protein n=1 Tax=Halomonas salina TaxID=42565 RepID=A0ABR4WRW4_9GAMM|nr:DUF945 family protein [Halomonas salina]KGE77456.1 hypothetical protein FP66_09865 [Halomonas salina]PSJ21781.1 DUF945 domain-containing protein [Halomonas sp. ND22Bw]
MRKERLIVPVLAVLALAWAVAQTLAGLLFERELTRLVAELRQGGELSVRRSDVERGWLTSHGVIHLAPLFGNAWHLDVVYRARHGVLETRLDGTLRPHAPEIEPAQRAVGAAPPRWDAHFRPYASTLDATLELAPLVFQQQARTLTLQGGRVAIHGDVGDWRLRARLAELRLDDGETRLSAGPLVLESRFAYTQDGFHFNQDDHWRLQNLAWRSPELAFDAAELSLKTRTVLDAEELRLKARLDVGEVLSGDEVLLTGELAGELSRLDADALRELSALLHREALLGHAEADDHSLGEMLTPALRELLSDSPRLDILEADLESPMLGLSLDGEGVLVFDARDLDALDPMALKSEAERAAWRERVDGDFLWQHLPPVIALGLGLPLDTRELQVDVVRGTVRINGRPLPPVLERWR